MLSPTSTDRRTRNLGAALVLMLLARDAYAYVDPNAGSLLLQLLLAGFAGAGVLVKIFWKKIKNKLGRGPKDES